MTEFGGERFKPMFAIVGAPIGEVAAQGFKVGRQASYIVAEEVFQCFAFDSKRTHDEAVIGFGPTGFLDWPLEIAFLLKVHQLTDAERAIGQRPVDSEKTTSIDPRNFGSTDDIIKQA
ncbi:hypothetical protein D3C87_1634580 [compost metagenome]